MTDSSSQQVQLGKTLQAASRLHVVDDRSTPIPPSSPPASQPNQKETHFSRHSAAFEVEHIFGTTAPTLLLPRERFSYWCFDLLFLICSSLARGKFIYFSVDLVLMDPHRSRIIAKTGCGAVYSLVDDPLSQGARQLSCR
jgi:hypothetical protein